MSILPTRPQFEFLSPNSHTSHHFIRKQILSLLGDERLKGKLGMPIQSISFIKIYFIAMKETLSVNFPQNFPESAPYLQLNDHEVPAQLINPESLHEWTKVGKLSDVVFEFSQSLSHYRNSQKEMRSKQSLFEMQDEERMKERSQENVGSKKKVMMNGCTDTQLTQTKNLNRHFRSKLRQVYNDLIKLTPPSQIPEDAKWIEESFGLSRVGFDDIARVLKNEWFNQEVCKQMENGRFMHKIMKGMMSIKSKKLMVKYYHVMLAAAKEPRNFVKWKYP